MCAGSQTWQSTADQSSVSAHMTHGIPSGILWDMSQLDMPTTPPARYSCAFVYGDYAPSLPAGVRTKPGLIMTFWGERGYMVCGGGWLPPPHRRPSRPFWSTTVLIIGEIYLGKGTCLSAPVSVAADTAWYYFYTLAIKALKVIITWTARVVSRTPLCHLCNL